ncbi:enoyl-CoA hydratase [Salipiger sp. 1_MG-2023]|uniref:enoyl-CoA hydratase n=1 Tax=Salipiger sp. 1_MG-2023 TaxID=3062665 RepID=UPI0026E3055F|nr:enoyl-CoA hydratase [Salipiger sp. 1_MG-2023]MDO6587397.1 enoyl-CoA hydratase [Salipiger sp. 1_MG-2023]
MADTLRSHGRVALLIEGAVATVTFDRPEARNAITFEMYRQLGDICDRLEATPGLRAIVFRGKGGAFVAGTDISEFTAFEGGQDGLAYEDKIAATIARVEALPAPTLAVIEGAAMGGGLVITTACDLRIVTPEARFGVPIARTVGNCLSQANVARLVRAFGVGPTKTMLLLSQALGGETAYRLGFASACVSPEALEEEVSRTVDRLCKAAPLTIAACREMVAKLEPETPDDAQTVARIYGSKDFREGVDAFLSKRKPEWSGT